MKTSKLAIFTAVAAFLAVAATLVVPFIQRWFEREAVSVQVVEPVKLSLLGNEAPATGAAYVTIVLVKNAGWKTLDQVVLPIAFEGLDQKRILQAETSTDPNFPVTLVRANDMKSLLIRAAYLNPGDAINVAIFSRANPGRLIEPRVRGIVIRMSEADLARDIGWLQIVVQVINLVLLVAIWYHTTQLKKDRLEVGRKLAALQQKHSI